MQEVERFRLRTRWFHWTVAVMFLVMAITGLFLYLPWVSPLAVGGWSRLAHRVAAVITSVATFIYLLSNWRGSWAFVKEAFTWSQDDLGWFQVAPDYYFGGDPSRMPPQGHINAGQKLWWLTALLGSIVIVITGAIMWFFKGIVPALAFQWSVFFHDVAFIAVGSFFLVHFYLSVFHPRMAESLNSMFSGKISVGYAKSHYGKWYEEVSKRKKR